jgi:acyl carrier protein
MALVTDVGGGIREALAVRLKRDVSAIQNKDDLRNDLGLDSLDMIELLFKIEEVFELEIPNEDLVKIATVGDVIAYVERRLAEKAAAPPKPAAAAAAPAIAAKTARAAKPARAAAPKPAPAMSVAARRASSGRPAPSGGRASTGRRPAAGRPEAKRAVAKKKRG